MASRKEEKTAASDSSEPQDAAPAGSSASTESSSRQDERTAFQEERKILLDNMTTQLQGVILKMARANEGIQRLATDSESVNDVGALWRESHEISKEIRKENGTEQNKSSIHAFPRGI